MIFMYFLVNSIIFVRFFSLEMFEFTLCTKTTIVSGEILTNMKIVKKVIVFQKKFKKHKKYFPTRWKVFSPRWKGLHRGGKYFWCFFLFLLKQNHFLTIFMLVHISPITMVVFVQRVNSNIS